ncbi:MAG TPA: methyltransferase domain-containing protein [Pseudonocardiaceae bacterium]|nr:methyltransferase domain-containing protein [Pseudonocardiaceae bacterium]
MASKNNRTDPYSTGPFSMDEPTERDRLLSLERAKDPDTIRILESLPINESSRCLEIGAGMGSIAYWLAARCPKGSVVAADIDTRNLDPRRSPNLNVQEVDITTHEFAPSSFDLVHARAVLCHLPAREDVLARAYRWISPGGWLVVEDVYSFPLGASPYPAMNRYAAAAHQAAEQRGGDLRWANRLPAIMAQLGFAHIAADASPQLVGSGGPSDRLWRINLEQTGPHMTKAGILTKAELDDCLRLLDDPHFVDIRHIGIAAWGQKPNR